jgi:glycosyltransferase involved in cell wall biosynthesis
VWPAGAERERYDAPELARRQSLVHLAGDFRVASASLEAVARGGAGSLPSPTDGPRRAILRVSMPSATTVPETPVVCHLVESLLHGGAETTIHRLAVGAKAAGYRAVVCCVVPGALVQRLERDGIQVEVLNLRRPSLLSGPKFVRFTWQLLAGLSRVVDRHRVTLIHAHLPDSIVWAAAVGTLKDIPVVGTYHGLGILPRNRSRLDARNLIRRTSYRWAHAFCRRTIVVSTAIGDLLRNDYAFRSETTVRIPNGIETSVFAQARDTSHLRVTLNLQRRRVITCVGRLIPSKGQRYLIDAMRHIAARYPDAHLLLVGDGRERPALEALVAVQHLGERVHFLGDRDDVPELLALTDIFVLPTFSEGLPVSVIEAMAAGKPVVTTAIPGNIEVVADERFGRLVPTANVQALAAAVIGLLDDPTGAREMALQGQMRARNHFDVAHMIAQTAAVYDSVLAENRRLHPSTA